MRRLSFLLILTLAACGSGSSADPDERAVERTAGPVEAAAPGARPADVVPAQDAPKYYREGLSGVDFSGMDAVQKERALKLMNAEPCDCGCGMTIAQCRVEDKTCPRSPSLAAAVVNAVRTGASDSQALVALKAFRDGGTQGGAQGSAPAARAVPVAQLKVADSPTLGPPGAAITVVTFEDFQ